MKKRLFAFLLIVCMLLCACQKKPQPTEPSTKPTTETTVPPTTEQPTEPTETTTEPTEPEIVFDPYEYIHYSELEREYEPYLEQLAFSKIEYVQPDAQTLCDGFAELQVMVEEEKTVEEIIDAYEALFEDYIYFGTMASYAYIQYCLDLNDSYYDEQNSWYDEQSPLIEQAREKCLIAMSESPMRAELEEEYFGEGFFEFYDENQIYSNDRVVELMQQESELESEYMALQSDMTIYWNGRERLVDELLDELSGSDYLEALRLNYEKYNPLCAEIFIKLIDVRKEIASVLEYDSYEDFAYFYYYNRAYSPEDVKNYCDEIAKQMKPLLLDALYAQNSASGERSTDESMQMLEDMANDFGGCIRTSYEFMKDYELYDISESSSKMPGSYMTYLDSYEMPFVYISPTGTTSDFMTATHEFGHFVDAYINCGGSESIDCAEIFSQGLEFLAIEHADLPYREREALSLSKAAESVTTFLSQACYAEFEQRAFALSEEELSVERLNELFMECNEKYGMSMLYTGVEDLLAPQWIDIMHFFSSPCYVISYCVSNDAALQIYQLDLEDGNGLDAYYNLLTIDREADILERLEAAEMVSPFEEGRVADLAEFLEERLLA